MLLTLIICLSSCNGFNWKPSFFEFSDRGIVNADGVEIYFNSPNLLDYSCLSKESIAELKAEIDRIKNRDNDLFENFYQ